MANIDFQPIQDSQMTPVSSTSNVIDFQPMQQNPYVEQLPIGMGTAFAGASNFLQGANEGVNQLGSLINHILKAGANKIYGENNPATQGLDIAGNAANAVSNKFNQYLQPQTPAEQQAVAQSSIVAPLAKTIGYMGANLGIRVPGVKPIVNSINTLGQSVAPTIMKSPVIQGALGQSVLGGTLGAASNPQDPLTGGLIGASIGAGLGAYGGSLGFKLRRGGDIVDFETHKLDAAGIDPTSVEGISRITNALKNNGVDMSKLSNQKILTNKIGEQLAKTNPVLNIDTSPAETLANLAKTNFADVSKQVKEGFQPIRDAQQSFLPQNYQSMVSSMDKSVLKQLPKQNMPANPNINDMWTYRERLDDVIQSVRAKAIQGNALKSDLVPLQQIRNAVTQDMLDSSDKLGLKNQFLQTENIYKNQYLPFKTLNTESGKLMSEKDIDQAMRTINTLMNPKISPKFAEIRDIATTLGSDGKKLIGQAMLQNMYNKSLTPEGVINPTQFFTQLKKAQVSGLSTRIFDQDTRDAANGIRTILEGTKQVMSPGSPQMQNPGMIKNVLDTLTKNRAGIGILKMIGSSKTPQTQVRSMLQNILTAGITTNLPTQSSQ